MSNRLKYALGFCIGAGLGIITSAKCSYTKSSVSRQEIRITPSEGECHILKMSPEVVISCETK